MFSGASSGVGHTVIELNGTVVGYEKDPLGVLCIGRWQVAKRFRECLRILVERSLEPTVSRCVIWTSSNSGSSNGRMNNKWFRIFVILRTRLNIQVPCYSCATSHLFIKSNVLGNTVVAHISYYNLMSDFFEEQYCCTLAHCTFTSFAFIKKRKQNVDKHLCPCH